MKRNEKEEEKKMKMKKLDIEKRINRNKNKAQQHRVISINKRRSVYEYRLCDFSLYTFFRMSGNIIIFVSKSIGK